ncbi:YihY/virulence factor BrkB family protein [Planococcus ruber]|uniref:YihY/virulence factor BrkB family protein n=1 Tax=Planococcus ruber TaxID=2027871 RepID=UPI001FEF533F|nr:YihY/virulence factor BrkB family protein [Planococcus ruber]MCJ1910193.1 YihY/virulence factor BrkB family protein [Planococcus ruber]
MNNLQVSHDVTTAKGFLKEVGKRIQEIDVQGLGAQLAFFFLLSIFPLLIFLVTLLPYLNLSSDQIYGFLQEVAPAEVYAIIEETLQDIMTNQNGRLLSFGIIATIWSASLGMDALIKSLNFSYGVEENRPFLIARGMSILSTILMIFIMIVALVLPIFGQQTGVFLSSFLGLEDSFLELWSRLRFTIPPLIIFAVCSVIYWVAPNVRLDVRSVMVGAAFTSIGWIAVSYIFSLYINHFATFSATYGSIGGIIMLMIWLYLSAMLLLVGGQINAVMQGRRNSLDRRQRNL